MKSIRLDALPSRKKVLLLATCHSGAGKSALPSVLAEEFAGTRAAVMAELQIAQLDRITKHYGEAIDRPRWMKCGNGSI